MRPLFYSAQRPRWQRLWLPLLLALLLLTGLAFHPTSSMAADAGPRRFTNSDGTVIDKSLGSVLLWNIESFWRRLSQTPTAQAAQQEWPVRREPAARQAAQPGELSVTWIGHATALLRLGGLTVITDPQFSERASPFSWTGPRRQVPLPLSLSELPHLDVVLISHNHYDHLDEASVLALSRQAGGSPLFLVPEGLDGWFRERGIERVQALPWWHSQSLGNVTFHAVPAHHWSARGLNDRNQTHWAGWVAKAAGQSVYFSGDTGYSKDFTAIGERLGPFDLALLPVGAYEPRDFMREQHVNPEEAVTIHREVRAKVSVGIHWGTFELADEGLAAPLTELPRARRQAGLPDSAFRLLAHGETLVLQAPTSTAAGTGKTP